MDSPAEKEVSHSMIFLERLIEQLNKSSKLNILITKELLEIRISASSRRIRKKWKNNCSTFSDSEWILKLKMEAERDQPTTALTNSWRTITILKTGVIPGEVTLLREPIGPKMEGPIVRLSLQELLQMISSKQVTKAIILRTNNTILSILNTARLLLKTLKMS